MGRNTTRNRAIDSVVLRICGLIFCIMPFFSKDAAAQEGFRADVGADFVSGYICRGQDYGGVSIQPSLTVSYNGVSLNAWGSVGFDGRDNKELDWTLKYEIGQLDIYITDYWISGGENRYFDFRPELTPHVLEAGIGYDFGFASLSWSTMFAGADYNPENGSRVYSSYINLAVPFSLGGLNWSAEIGATPWTTGYYAKSDGFSVCVIALGACKQIKIGNAFSLPASVKLLFNPTTDRAYLTFGLSF